MRLDLYLSSNELAKSRSFAKTLIEEGFVSVDGKTVKKVSFDVPEGADVVITGKPYEFVSRGGVKLDFALECFQLDVKDAVCVDIGASSGGFTDCLLKRGADKVYAVDSGFGQLAEELVNDNRVVNIENFNARYLSWTDLGAKCDVCVTDVSFISQTLIHKAVKDVLKDNGMFVSLIKPQFECGREGLGKGGIVKGKKYIENSIVKVIESAEENGLGCVNLVKSPVLGGDGNTEFLMLALPNEKSTISLADVKNLVGDLKIKN